MKIMQLAVAVVLVGFVAVAHVQNSRTFPLNKPIPEVAIQCFTRMAAVDIADAGDGSGAVFMEHMKSGTCVVMKAIVTYTKKVYQGRKLGVYEGRVGNVTVYSPTTWVAKGELDL